MKKNQSKNSKRIQEIYQEIFKRTHNKQVILEIINYSMLTTYLLLHPQ